jgi:serine/threonine protein kinase/lipoprotein NlpI
MNDAPMNNSEQTTTEQHLGPLPLPAAPDPASDQELLLARLTEEMAQAWRQGERPGAEEFLKRHPGLADRPSAVLDLLYEEVRLRHEYGEPVDLEEITKRFPAWRQQIEILVPCVFTLESGVLGGFPEAGDTVGDFRLLAELGRGGQGRVFVAAQSSLGGRPVVLKIAARGSHEHLSLARLQHTHIVPLLSVLDEPQRNLRVLCMPYYGGLTLAALLTALMERPADQRTGADILEVLDEARAAAAVSLPPSRDPATPFLSRASYVEAISWLGACLAEALKYAHERGLVHLDLKPSNVLLTADRQPMLLDFHLARGPLRAGDIGRRLGGTPLYMSREQQEAIAALRRGEPVPEAIDGRSDIFSLGLVLYEALGGKVADANHGLVIPLWRCNPQVSPGLSDIIAKCLAPEAKNRYRDAGALAADLWNHLNDQPLKGVTNRSLAERWRKWRRRKPHLLSYLALYALVFTVATAALAFAFWHVDYRREEANQALADAKRSVKEHKYAEAIAQLQRGLSRLDRLPSNQELREDLTSELDFAQRGRLAEELNQIVDGVRVLYGVDPALFPRLRDLEARCRDFWDKRKEILAKLGEEPQPRMQPHRDEPAQIRQQVQHDLLDLAILLSNFRVRLAGDHDRAARREALRMLQEAEDSFWPSAVLYEERRGHTEALGLTEVAQKAAQRAAELPPKTAWEHYALGRALLHRGEQAGAARELERAVALEPNGVWASFYLGLCNYQLGRYSDAVEDFTACLTRPRPYASCFFNRGLAYVALGEHARALRDFDRARQLDAELASTALRQALLEQERALAADPISTQAHFHLAILCLAQNDRASAISHLAASLAGADSPPAAADLLQSLRAER